ncbi:MAG: hypothetical protein AAFP19_03920 [Bacteroidota bacterium]
MKKSKLIRVFDTLSRKEQREFRLFLQSPLYNQRTDLMEFYDLLLNYQKLGRPLPEKVAFFEELFPQKPYSGTQLDLLMSYLFKVEKVLQMLK